MSESCPLPTPASTLAPLAIAYTSHPCVYTGSLSHTPHPRVYTGSLSHTPHPRVYTGSLSHMPTPASTLAPLAIAYTPHPRIYTGYVCHGQHCSPGHVPQNSPDCCQRCYLTPSLLAS